MMINEGLVPSLEEEIRRRNAIHKLKKVLGYNICQFNSFSLCEQQSADSNLLLFLIVILFISQQCSGISLKFCNLLF